MLQDDKVHREGSVNPTALHVTDTYVQTISRHGPTSCLDFILWWNVDYAGTRRWKFGCHTCSCTWNRKIHDKVAELDVHYIDNIDSSNMSPEIWDTIGRVILEHYNDYDGFVVTHGTDTMAYTASALSFVLGDLGKPVVMTGAQIPGCATQLCQCSEGSYIGSGGCHVGL